MFRQGIRRCAGLAGAARSTSMMLRTRAALPTAASLSRRNAPLSLNTLALASRLYSTEAVAQDASKGQDSVPGELSNFADLAQLGVHENLLGAIVRDMKYEAMTPVQAKTINPALKGNDIVAQAKTGTGKTLAFLLPLLQRMINEDPSLARRSASYRARSDDIRGIILSPTRELAEQIAVEARRVTKNTGLVVQSAVGGTQKSLMLREVQRNGCHLLVATPGRLNDLLSDPRSGIAAPNLAALVLDEADRMLDVGFEKELDEIVSRLPSPKEKVRQTMLVSATIPDNVIRLARTMIRPDDFTFVQTIPENESLTHDRVPQHIVLLASWANAFPSIFELIDREMTKFREDPANSSPFKAIVYFNTTAMVELCAEMAYHGRRNDKMPCSTFAIHSRLSQGQRSKAADMFREAKNAVLFSSDVTARGMDFPNVTHVLQVDLPRDRESYIHRLGRTARQGKDGQGWLFMPPLSMNSARRTLQGLPLAKNDSLISASVDPESGEPTRHHKDVAQLMQMAKRHFSIAYQSLFGGQTSNREELVDDLNRWAVQGVGFPEPPAVSPDGPRDFGRGGPRDFGREMSHQARKDDVRGGRGQSFGRGGGYGGRGRSSGGFGGRDRSSGGGRW
ncbi:DEAD/DEAH box helicase [Hirsutella rhossiliensis]|uniref:ATP-dependent RNA helicase n=1 Tax=Hirsutella rhossiliensis TaxID=111463 RepID=A0A9P8N2L0_9HYPO|nr:DEAD/DEAH box helicase domain-containing protein [Hirsutella rhossiliensis]KAH0965694.1 DEAD/DEAH box helicase domain-containing protein [Hirsutella rhossiliensis]